MRNRLKKALLVALMALALVVVPKPVHAQQACSYIMELGNTGVIQDLQWSEGDTGFTVHWSGTFMGQPVSGYCIGGL